VGRGQDRRAVGEVEQRLAEAGADQAPVGLGEQRLGDLVTAARPVVERGLERVEPGLDAVVDVADVTSQEPRPEAEQHQADEHERHPVGGHVEHGQEAAEEHQRRSQVADEHEHQHRRAPDDEQRPEVLERRNGQAHEPPRAHDQYLARVAQVGGDEDDQADLGQLGGLERDRADLDPQVGAVDLGADARHAREHQQPEPDEGDRVAIALEHAVVAYEQDHRHERNQAHDEPLRLLARQRVVDPVDDDEPEAREQRHQREEVRVGVGEREPQEDVRGQAQPEEDRSIGERDVAEDVLLLDEDGRKPAGQQKRGRDEAEQLAVARAHRSCPVSSCRTRSVASLRERSSLSSSDRRRVVGTCDATTPEL
jgi:hypothetical protein